MSRPTANGGAGAVASSATVEHLWFLLDKQPSCLMRIGCDGTILACNDAALSLLGTADRRDILGTTFERHLGGQAASWREFVSRVWRDGAGSFECDLPGGHRSRRVALLHGIALHDHPDQIDSLLIAIRDNSALRQLEACLHEQEHVISLDEPAASAPEAGSLEPQVASLMAERDQLASEVEQYRAAAAEHDRVLDRHVEHMAALERDIASASLEIERLQALVSEQRGRCEQLEAESASADSAHARQTRVDMAAPWRRLATELEPLAAAGRLAIQVCGTLQDVLAALDDGAVQLLQGGGGDLPAGCDPEALRTELLRAASLVRQLGWFSRAASVERA